MSKLNHARGISLPLLLAIIFVFISHTITLGASSSQALATAQPATSHIEQAVPASNQSSSQESVENLVAGLSDEQARVMLLEELKKKQLSSEQDIEASTHGPDALLDKLLHSLSQRSDSSEHHVQQLLSAIPNVIPDLYKVFVKL